MRVRKVERYRERERERERERDRERERERERERGLRHVFSLQSQLKGASIMHATLAAV